MDNWEISKRKLGIERNLHKLRNSDYKVVRYSGRLAAGLATKLTSEEFAALEQERNVWREEISTWEEEITALEAA